MARFTVLRLIGEMRAPALVAILYCTAAGGEEHANPITVSQIPYGISTKSVFVIAGMVAGTDMNTGGSCDTAHVDLLRRMSCAATVEPVRRAGAKDITVVVGADQNSLCHKLRIDQSPN